MRFVIDLDSLELIESATDRRKVQQVEGKRGDDAAFEVVFVRSGVAEELAGSSVLTFGAKQDGKYDAATVVLEDGFTLSGSGTTAKYTASPSFHTEALNALFAIDGDDSNDPPYVDLMAEFTWRVGAGAPTSTKTFRFRVHNDVVRDDETSPTPAYNPIGDTAPQMLKQTVAGTTSPDFDGDLLPSGIINGKESFSISGDSFTETVTDDGVYCCWNGTSWVLFKVESSSVVGSWLSSDAVDSPDLVTTWTPDAGETGLPLFTAEWTPAPPYIRTAGGFLYIQEAGVWKKTALSSL